MAKNTTYTNKQKLTNLYINYIYQKADCILFCDVVTVFVFLVVVLVVADDV